MKILEFGQVKGAYSFGEPKWKMKLVDFQKLTRDQQWELVPSGVVTPVRPKGWPTSPEIKKCKPDYTFGKSVDKIAK